MAVVLTYVPVSRRNANIGVIPAGSPNALRSASVNAGLIVLNLNDTEDAIAAVLIAVVAGSLGGLVSELLLERGKSRTIGVLILPTRQGRRIEIGSAAAILIGFAAGLLATALWVPVTDVGVNNVN